MNCNLIFKINGQEISIPYESESSNYPSWSEIINTLKDNSDGKTQEIIDLIKEKYSLTSINTFDLAQLQKDAKDGKFDFTKLVGNKTFSELEKMFPEVTFPEGIEGKVLLVDHLKLGGVNMISSRIFTANGEELFIVRNNKEDVKRLVSFLNVRKTLQDNPNYYSEGSPNYDKLEIIRKNLNVSTVPDLIIDFIENKSSYRTKLFTDSEGKTRSVYTLLDQIAREINGSSEVIQYEDELVNLLSKLHTYHDSFYNGDFEVKLFQLPYKEIYTLLKSFHPEMLDKLGIKSQKSFVEKAVSEDFNKEAFPTYYEGQPLIVNIYNNIIKADPRYQYKVHRVDTNNIIIKKHFPKIGEKYEVGYSELSSKFNLVNSNYKGYKLYEVEHNGKKEYTFSREYILHHESTARKSFDTLKELENFLDNYAKEEKLSQSSFIDFKFRLENEDGTFDQELIYNITSKQSLKARHTYEVLNIPINKSIKTGNNLELNLINSKTATVQDVHNLIKSWNLPQSDSIIDLLDNAEKCLTYLYKINQTKEKAILQDERTNGEELYKIAKEISNAEKVAYYVSNKSGTTYSLIPTNPAVITQIKSNNSAPIITLLNGLKTALSDINVNVNLLTSSQIEQKFPQKKYGINPNTSKAFICDGQIYVNTTIASGQDLLHEYTHLMLGVLKANPNTVKGYEQILYAVAERSENELNALRKIYKGLTEMDLYEELFVKKFTQYLNPNINPNSKEINDIFKQSEEYLTKATQSIFNLDKSESLEDAYTKSLNTIFKRFSHDISLKIKQGNQLDFDLVQTSRRRQKWIADQIKQGNIIERCL